MIVVLTIPHSIGKNWTFPCPPSGSESNYMSSVHFDDAPAQFLSLQQVLTQQFPIFSKPVTPAIQHNWLQKVQSSSLNHLLQHWELFKVSEQELIGEVHVKANTAKYPMPNILPAPMCQRGRPCPLLSSLTEATHIVSCVCSFSWSCSSFRLKSFEVSSPPAPPDSDLLEFTLFAPFFLKKRYLLVGDQCFLCSVSNCWQCDDNITHTNTTVTVSEFGNHYSHDLSILVF